MRMLDGSVLITMLRRLAVVGAVGACTRRGVVSRYNSSRAPCAKGGGVALPQEPGLRTLYSDAPKG